MNFKKLAPWNWFNKEESHDGHAVPVNKTDSNRMDIAGTNSLPSVFDEFDRLFGNSFGRFRSFWPGHSNLIEGISGSLLKPNLDLIATEKEYTVHVEIPGVNEKDINLSISDDTLTISGEKKQASEEKKKQYYHIERSYGSFQRVLCLPRDADQEHIKANFKKGVLTVTIPRNTPPESQVKQIQINYAK